MFSKIFVAKGDIGQFTLKNINLWIPTYLQVYDSSWL